MKSKFVVALMRMSKTHKLRKAEEAAKAEEEAKANEKEDSFTEVKHLKTFRYI